MFGYHLQMKDRNSILWQKVNKMVIRATHFKVTNINAGLIYEFKVAAENAAGISAFSKISDAVLAIDACGKLNNYWIIVKEISFCCHSCLVTNPIVFSGRATNQCAHH